MKIHNKRLLSPLRGWDCLFAASQLQASPNAGRYRRKGQPLSYLTKFISILILVVSFSETWATENTGWGDALGANSRNVGDFELVYWDGEANVAFASDVLKWFGQLPFQKQVFENGKVIIAPRDSERNGVYEVLKRMNRGKVSKGFKGIEGTSKQKGKRKPPFNSAPFIIVSSESIRRYNVGLIHELLHQYYWSMPPSAISEVEAVRDTLIASNGDGFAFKSDPGHVYVWSCQYFPLGYHSIVYEHFSLMADICKSTLGDGQINPRGTSEKGVRLWASSFASRNGMVMKNENGRVATK